MRAQQVENKKKGEEGKEKKYWHHKHYLNMLMSPWLPI